MKFDPLATVISIVAALATVCTQPAMSEEHQSQTAAPSAYVKPKISHESYGEVKVVVPLTTEDKGLQRMKLANISNSLKAGEAWKGKFTVKVVLYGKGLSLLTNPDEQTEKQLVMLRSRGVQFMVCDNSLAAFGIDFHTLYGVAESDIVPSGFAEVAYLQAQRGYVADSAN